MASQYRVTLRAAADDGTNIYCDVEISTGAKTFPLIRPVFPTGTAASVITTYMQTIADNAPTLAGDVAAILNVPVIGA